MRPLFEISDDMLALEEILAAVGGEITEDEAGAALQDWFDNLDAERDQKLDNYAALIREFESRSEARANEAKRLMALAGSDENNAKRLRGRLKLFFELHDISKIDTRRFRISLQANGGAVPVVVPEAWREDPATAPEQFHKRRIELNLDAIRDAIRNDEDAHGAKLGERGSHIRIR